MIQYSKLECWREYLTFPISKSSLAILAICLTALIPLHNCFAMSGQVIIEGGAAKSFSLNVAENLTRILNQLETGDLSSVQELFTDEGYEIISDVISLFPMTNASKIQKTKLITYPGGGWEVRDLRVFVKSGDADAAGMLWQYLVFTLDSYAKVTGVRFSLKMRNYKDVLEAGKLVQTGTMQKRLFDFLHSLESSYNMRQADKIINFF